MKLNKNRIAIIILLFANFICIIGFVYSIFNVNITNNSITTKVLQVAMEQAYYEGQKDAIEGDIRIKHISDTTYVWIKSPWDSGRDPIYKP